MKSREEFSQVIARDLKLSVAVVNNCLKLQEEGGTVPFIARYRKEMTGGLDEVAIAKVFECRESIEGFETRKHTILQSLKDREILTKELEKAIKESESLSILEDIYLPYKPKRKTRATIAKNLGLEPLAEMIFTGKATLQLAAEYVNNEGVDTIEKALAGARDIVAERISESMKVRSLLRDVFRKEGVVVSKLIKGKEEEAQKFKDYFDFEEPVKRVAGHRLLALLRGEEQKLLRVAIRPDRERGLNRLKNHFFGRQKGNEQFFLAMEDSYSRLLAPALENELRKELKERADEEAIEVFSVNVKKLLLASPLGQRRVMALDPGYRTGAKLVCLDEQGALLHNETIFPTHGGAKAQQAEIRVKELVKEYDIEAIGIGNGTAGRETESFIRRIELGKAVIISLINEDGASIYSASETARQEFPEYDITVRGAVSIGRRFQDPLAELVKIDPKSIGVGQYQHDVNQKKLKKGLTQVVTNCVNNVGVEINSSSVELLSYVAGLGESHARNITEYRAKNGPFQMRKEILKVPRLGEKAFEQCAGFLRIQGAKNPLDRSGVHPERYSLVEQMATDLKVSVNDLLQSEPLRKRINIKSYITGDVGEETLADILDELARPGRDPREQFLPFEFDKSVQKIEDVQPGMVLPAIITNVTKFGAFADIGVKQDGLIHISQMADRFIDDPGKVVHVQQKLKVRVLEVDMARKRIALSLKSVV